MSINENHHDPLLGAELDGRFRLDELLGQGGMGRVYAGTQLSVNRTVAVKIVRDELAQSEVVKQRFLLEARSIAGFSHPSIVRLIDFGEDEARGLLYLVMEHVRGDTLSDVIADGPLRPDIALRVVARLASGLSEAHANGIIHRDLKPENVMLAPAADGGVQPLILDFGVALPQELSVRLTEDGRICGTPAYMAPEQARSQSVGPATDMYALGVLLFEMLTCALPISAPTPMSLMLKKLQHAAPRLGEVLGRELLPGLEDLVAALLEIEPAGRIQSADQLVASVERILGSGDLALRLDDRRGYSHWFAIEGETSMLVPTMLAAPALPTGSVALARRCSQELRWDDAVAAFEATPPKEPEDLEQFGRSLYMLGRDDEFVEVFGRAYQAFLDRGDHPRAVRCAFWLGLTLAFRGKLPVAGAWLARAERALEQCPDDSPERGYLKLPRVHEAEGEGDLEAALQRAVEALEIGERHRDAELTALARHLEGKIRLGRGETGLGLALLDETMLTVTTGQLTPMVTGLVYCSVISGCHDALALARSRQWTNALSSWCAGQPSLVAFTGKCLVHRAEVMRVSGEWDEALKEADRACQRFAQHTDEGPASKAWYERAEVHRLRGQLDEAEAAYQRASDLGRDPQPGLALLRNAQGDVDKALGALRRVRAAMPPGDRAPCLAAFVEVALAAGKIDEAREAAAELDELAAVPERDVIAAMAAYARASVELADGDPGSALRSLGRSQDLWADVGAPFELARCRLLKSRACSALDDTDGAELELRAARREFDRLGAALPGPSQNHR